MGSESLPTTEELSDETPVAVEFVGVRSSEGDYRTLETEVVENGLTSDDPTVVELAEYHSDSDPYPRRRLVFPDEDDDGVVRLEARRSIEDGTQWALFARSGTVSVRVREDVEANAEPVEA